MSENPLVAGSQAGKPTRTMLARRAFSKLSPRDANTLNRTYAFKHGTMTLEAFIEKASVAGGTVDTPDGSNRSNLTWGSETVGLPAAGRRYWTFLHTFQELTP